MARDNITIDINQKSPQRQRLDNLIEEGLALLICNLCKKMEGIDDTERLEKRTNQIVRLCEEYRRVGE